MSTPSYLAGATAVAATSTWACTDFNSSAVIGAFASNASRSAWPSAAFLSLMTRARYASLRSFSASSAARARMTRAMLSPFVLSAVATGIGSVSNDTRWVLYWSCADSTIGSSKRPSHSAAARTAQTFFSHSFFTSGNGFSDSTGKMYMPFLRASPKSMPEKAAMLPPRGYAV